MGFHVDVRKDAAAVTVAPEGELDLAGEGRFEAAIQQALETALSLTIDLSALDFIDSSGLRVLVRLHNTAQRDGFSYTVVPGPPQVHRTFVLCGLDATLPFAAPSAK